MDPARVVRDADVRAGMHESERSVRCSVAPIDCLLEAASCIGGPPRRQLLTAFVKISSLQTRGEQKHGEVRLMARYRV
jgi:hypothetical protein